MCPAKFIPAEGMKIDLAAAVGAAILCKQGIRADSGKGMAAAGIQGRMVFLDLFGNAANIIRLDAGKYSERVE